MTIQTIIKKAVKRLELEGKLLTPDFYAEAFCKEAAKAGMTTDDCSHIQKLRSTLNKDLQEELKRYRIKTIHEFTRFVIAKLNRTNPSHCAQTLDSQTLLLKRTLQVVEVLHNKEASDLAHKSIDLLNSSPSVAQLEQYRQSWVNFLTTYDDTFLKKLSSFGSVDTGDLKKSIENLNLDASKMASGTSVNLSAISSLLVSSLVPSIASSVNEKIASVSDKIKSNPELLESASMAQEIKNAISLRIALDKDSVKEMVESIDGVLDKLSLRLIDMIEQSDNSTVEIQKIKRELESYSTQDATNFNVAHKKLFTIAIALEENTQLLSKDLKNHSGEVQLLAKKIEKLEKELAASREESKEDFLTKMYNRRALDDLIQIKEAEFKRHGRNFAIIMFDLDHFKAVNDDYGHDAGDAVLSAFAKILKKEARTEDVIGRYGGEEFMGVLGQTDIKGGVIFAEKVRKQVQKARFMYKGQRIGVTVSCGVAERAKYITLEDTIKASDELLYKAKKDGRNQVAHKK